MHRTKKHRRELGMCFFEMLVLKVNMFLTINSTGCSWIFHHPVFWTKNHVLETNTQNLSKSLETDNNINQSENMERSLHLDFSSLGEEQHPTTTTATTATTATTGVDNHNHSCNNHKAGSIKRQAASCILLARSARSQGCDRWWLCHGRPSTQGDQGSLHSLRREGFVTVQQLELNLLDVQRCLLYTVFVWC